MANDREKMIELLKYAPFMKQTHGVIWVEAMAQWLIDNGVTFAKDTDVPSKWIRVDHPPENWKGEGGYLTNFYVYTPEYGVDIGNYVRPANKWVCMGIPCNVTHWMPLPEPPRVQGVPNGTDHV